MSISIDWFQICRLSYPTCWSLISLAEGVVGQTMTHDPFAAAEASLRLKVDEHEPCNDSSNTMSICRHIE
jgi:hypothetical protein